MCVLFCCVQSSVSHLRLSGSQSAGTFEDVEKPKSSYQKTKPVEAGERSATPAVFESQLFATCELIASLSLIFHSPAGSSTGSIKARFENIAKQKEEEDKKRAEEERARRQAKEKQEQEEARRIIEETAKAPSPVPAASPSPTPPAQPPAAPTYEVSHGGL